MFARCATILSAAVLALALLIPTPVYAQRMKKEEPVRQSNPKPVVQYIVVVVLLAIPIGLICRSSRRQT
jgi:hypothetical protein